MDESLLQVLKRAGVEDPKKVIRTIRDWAERRRLVAYRRGKKDSEAVLSAFEGLLQEELLRPLR